MPTAAHLQYQGTVPAAGYPPDSMKYQDDRSDWPCSSSSVLVSRATTQSRALPTGGQGMGRWVLVSMTNGCLGLCLLGNHVVQGTYGFTAVGPGKGTLLLLLLLQASQVICQP